MILEKYNEDEKMSDCLINPKQIDRVDIFRIESNMVYVCSWN